MSDHIATVSAIYEAFGRGDVGAIMERLADDVRWEDWPDNSAQAVPRAVAPSSREYDKFFESEVRPILQANCFACHGGEAKIKGGLKLTSRETILKGGDTGPAISLARPDDSLLLRAIHYKGDLQMPPDGPLPLKEVDTLTRWVKEGLPWTPGTVDMRRPDAKDGVVTEAAKRTR